MTDIEIARSVSPKPIQQIADKLNIPEKFVEQYGKDKAKISADLIEEAKWKANNLILVTAITPTPAGEGKTTTTIGLTDGLNKIGKQATAVIREPSLGPVFGIKGGAAGGGYAQVIPMEDINLHFTGDFNAIEKANNLLAAMIDNVIQNPEASLHIDPRTVTWKRVMDMNDRALRKINSGLGGKSGGFMRETGFDITAASEIMAILCLPENLEDLKNRLGNIYVGKTVEGNPVFAREIGAVEAMTILLKDAIKPNLVQTLEGNPAIVHGGPFANIAQGTNSVIATKLGLSLSEYVVTEAGFGADLGAEKFLDIKCRQSGLSPKAVVVVATIRALKYHGGVSLKELNNESTSAVQKGLSNLEKHVENIQCFGIPVVVCINKFSRDTDAEIEVISAFCAAKGVEVSICEGWEKGGAGASNLAEKVVHACATASGSFTPIYELSETVTNKIEALATKIYGADGVEYSAAAKRVIKEIDMLGLNDLPICMAKTQSSLSDNPKLIGRPTGFTLFIREIELAAGAGFIIPITGSMLRMPGLPKKPAAENMTIDNRGIIHGLS